MIFRRFLSTFLLISLGLSINPTSTTRATGLFQGDDPAVNAIQMLAKMRPEERVGQLFLVTFNGSTADENSQIYDLITNYHVGGVALLASNDNFAAFSSPMENEKWVIGTSR